MDRVVKAAKKGVEKAKKEQHLKDEEEKRKVMSDAESAALKLIQHKKNTAMFLFDWVGAGHQEVQKSADVTTFVNMMTSCPKGASYSMPHLVELFPATTKDYAPVFTNYMSQASSHFAKKNVTKAFCDLEERHGKSDFLGILKQFLPESLMLSEVLPTTQVLMDTHTMFAFAG